MNDYRITYTSNYGNKAYQVITARTESAARRAFITRYKISDPAICCVELVKKNTNATKDQERDALKKIKKLVSELGPDSYLRVAFEGCFEDAENNIKDAAAYSMKHRWESAERQLVDKEGEISYFKDEVTRMHGVISRLKKDNEDLSLQLANHSISSTTMEKIAQIISDRVIEVGKRVASAAENIVDFAESPESADFISSVHAHREALHELQDLKDLLLRVNNVKNQIA